LRSVIAIWTKCSTALHAPHELGDAGCELGPQTEWEVMSHFLNQDEFCAGNGFSRRSPSIGVTHAVGDAVDHEGGDIEMSQAFGPIAGGDAIL
jgi:hypothetical protein